MIRSEHTCDMSLQEIVDLQNKVKNMSPDELKSFRNSVDPDLMGFCGEEAIADEN